MNRLNKGFTLMELLIVIGVLGILAAGLLAAIDPFEQLKKARDTNNRSAAIEMLQSSQRYYANHGYLPWLKQTTPPAYDCIDSVWSSIRPTTVESGYPHAAVVVAPDGSDNSNPDVLSCIENTLGADGEIKATFFQGLKVDLYVQSGNKTRAAVCFAPEARSNRSDTQTAYSWNNVDQQVENTCTADQRSAGECLQCFE